MRKTFVGIAALAAAAGCAFGQVRLSELLINPPGTDQGLEFIELSGTPNCSLDGLWIIEVDGDGTNGGRVNTAINLTGFSLGSNGLWLQRDTALVIDTDPFTAGVQGPSAGTNVRVADFAPDIQNGSGTFLLVNNFTGSVGFDLDTNDDGMIDVAAPWSSILDGIGFVEEDGTPADDFQYASQLGFFGFGITPDALGGFYSGDALVRGIDDLWYIFDTTGTSPGTFFADPNETTQQGAGLLVLGPTANYLTPGAFNVVPTPGAVALLGLGGLLVARRRRKA